MSGQLRPGDHVYLIAICGVGMASLAGLLQSQGYRVRGSDQNSYPPMSTYLGRLGIEVLAGYSVKHLVRRPDLVVIGNAVSRNNPEVQSVLDLGIPYLSFPQALGRFLIGSKRSIVVVGAGDEWKAHDDRLARMGFSEGRMGSEFFCRRHPPQLRYRVPVWGGGLGRAGRGFLISLFPRRWA